MQYQRHKSAWRYQYGNQTPDLSGKKAMLYYWATLANVFIKQQHVEAIGDQKMIQSVFCQL